MLCLVAEKREAREGKESLFYFILFYFIPRLNQPSQVVVLGTQLISGS